MKKFNVKVLSMAVTAAVASGAAGAAEQNFAAAVGGKDDQGQAAFFTVFGEGTTYDKGTGKLTFKKDSDALLLKTLELEQTINGFASGSNFITTDANGNKTVREATNEDIEADSLKGVGLAGGLTAVNARMDKLEEETETALDDQDETIEELKTAITTNGTRIAEVATGVNKLNESVAEMGKDISTKFDEVDSEISKASSELSESIEKVSEDVTAVNTRVDSLAQDTADAKAAAKAAEDKVTELSANVDSKVKEAKDAADKAVDAASKLDAVADKADKASKGVAGLTVALEKVSEQALLASAENAQALNGFAEGDEIVVTDKDGIKSIKTATKEDVENADFEGMGLKEVVAAHDETLDGLTNAVTENSEALVKTAEVVNAISADVNANKAALEEQEKANEGFNNAIASLDEDISTLKKVGLAAAEALEVNRQDIDANKAAIETKADKADFEELAKYTADMGKKVNDIGDEVTALSDATNAAITRHDKDIVDLAQAGLKATEALEANRKDIDANKAAIAENTAKLEEQKEANEGFNNAIASLDKDIGDLASAGKAAMEALEINRQDIDANKAAIETKADKADFEELAKYTADMGKKVNDIGDEVTALSDATNAAITRHDKDIVDLAQAGLKATEALEANRKDIDANTKYIGDLALAGKAAADALEANRQDIDANKAAIAENTAKLEEQKEANEGFNNAIASLDEDIITLKKADLAAADALKAHRTDIDANKAAIETKADKTAVESVRTIAVEAQKSAQAAKGAVEVAQKSAETADSHAKAAQTAAAKAQESADTNAVQIAANTKQIDTNKTDIAALQTANGQHAAGIAKNSARIDSLDKNVANLRKETRQGLAAQAALSGLFQPYSVGKFNLTAALGGFKSDTAVAVGAGYRFNENFAAKAGLAVGTSSGGSASYNVGLNYEW